jgi:hypothetical protein
VEEPIEELINDQDVAEQEDEDGEELFGDAMERLVHVKLVVFSGYKTVP